MKTNDGKEIFLCKECTHSQASWWDRLTQNTDSYKCNRLTKLKIDPVTGAIVLETEVLCKNARRFSSDECGTDAKLWAPKNKKDLFRLIQKVSDE